MFALGDGRPTGGLGLGGPLKPALEPLLDDGMKLGEGHEGSLAQGGHLTCMAPVITKRLGLIGLRTRTGEGVFQLYLDGFRRRGNQNLL